MNTFLNDIKYACRILKKHPGFTLTTMLILALGIGGVTTMLSVINGVFIKYLPYHEPDNLVTFVGHSPMFDETFTCVSARDYEEWKSNNHSFSEMAVYVWHSSHSPFAGWSDTQDNMKDLEGLRVEPSFFQVLRIQPMMGRALTAQEQCFEETPVVLLGHHIWQNRFDSDPDVIGQTIKLDGKSCSIIGVMPPNFRFFPSTYRQANGKLSPNQLIDYWIPLSKKYQTHREGLTYDVVARLQPDVTVSQAQSDMNAIVSALQQKYPNFMTARYKCQYHVNAFPDYLLGSVRSISILALAAAGFVLLIVCVNVTNLITVRSIKREREMAVRACLGGHSIRLARQMLVEQLVLFLPAGGLGILMSCWGVQLLIRMAPDFMPGLDQIAVDAWVIAAALGITLGTSLIVGLLPALRLLRGGILNVLKSSRSRTFIGIKEQRRFGFLVASEIALALVLLFGAGLMVRSFQKVMAEELGVKTDNVLTFRVSGPKLSEEYDRIMNQLRSVPGVSDVASACAVPLSDQSSDMVVVKHQDDIELPLVWLRTVSDDYFKVMGIRLQKGCFFESADAEQSRPVLIVNETLKRKLCPGEEALGKQVHVELSADSMGAGGDVKSPTCEIIGVIADIKHEGPDKKAEMEIYLPYRQRIRKHVAMTFVLRCFNDPENLMQVVKQEIEYAGPSLIVSGVSTMNGLYAQATAPQRLLALSLTSFSSVAFVLALLGIYGVTAYTVSLRAHEIGIRSALGARRLDIIRMLFRRSIPMICGGLVLGLMFSLALGRILSSLLYEVSAWDPLTLLTGIGMVTFVSLIACYIPARRAARIDPMEALRYE